jgi:hypothetical protein
MGSNAQIRIHSWDDRPYDSLQAGRLRRQGAKRGGVHAQCVLMVALPSPNPLSGRIDQRYGDIETDGL